MFAGHVDPPAGARDAAHAVDGRRAVAAVLQHERDVLAPVVAGSFADGDVALVLGCSPRALEARPASTRSWRAITALRIRVSMSEMGSVSMFDLFTSSP